MAGLYDYPGIKRQNIKPQVRADPRVRLSTAAAPKLCGCACYRLLGVVMV